MIRTADTQTTNVDGQPSETAVSNRMAVTLDVRDASDRLFALGEWQTLEARLSDVPLMCSVDWTTAWLDAFGDLIPHWFVLARCEQTKQVVGACLVTSGVGQKDGPIPIRTLHLGTAGEPEADSVCVEYNDLLVEESARTEFCRLLWGHFKQKAGIDQWNIDGADVQLITEFNGVSNRPLTCREEVAHWFDLTVPRQKGTTVLDELRSATRRKVRRNLKAFEELTVDWSSSLEDATDIFSELVELHQARWNAIGKPGSYSSARFVRFHEALLARLVPTQRLFLIRVRDGSRTVGCLHLLNDRNRILLYQCGWASTDTQCSPGVVVDYLAMEECLKRGFDAFDFLAYETQHKRHLSNRSTPLIWAHERRTRLKFALLNVARGLKRKLQPESGGNRHDD